MPYLDFQEIKSRFPIDNVAELLGLETKKSGNQLRAPCPACKSGGDRALAITPSKSLFFCFAAQKGGDQLALIAHIKGISTKEAAEWLTGTSTTVPGTSTVQGTVRKNHATGFNGLDYLEADHAAVQTLGFDPETAKALGIGYAPKGVLRGLVAVPIRLEDGSLAGYIGVSEARLPSRWHLGNVVPFKKEA